MRDPRFAKEQEPDDEDALDRENRLDREGQPLMGMDGPSLAILVRMCGQGTSTHAAEAAKRSSKGQNGERDIEYIDLCIKHAECALESLRALRRGDEQAADKHQRKLKEIEREIDQLEGNNDDE